MIKRNKKTENIKIQTKTLYKGIVGIVGIVITIILLTGALYSINTLFTNSQVAEKDTEILELDYNSEFAKSLLNNNLLLNSSPNTYNSNKYVNGVWLTTLANLDFPKTDGSESQKNEIINYLDVMVENNLSDIFFQVRPESDALYKSSINPWSQTLTGTQGKDPGYDPLEFMIQEAKKRGLKVHAWLNPYRISKSKNSLTELCETHPARMNPSMVIEHEGTLYYNPSSDDTVNHIISTVKELVVNYPELSSIHFDDYFYPSGYMSHIEKDSPEEDKMRDDITNMIKEVYKTVHQYSSTMEFGVSPRGIYKNINTNSSSTKGTESYYADKADIKKWIDLNIIDYVIPQIYWNIGHPIADYEIITKWWADTVKNSNVDLYIGHNTYTETTILDLENQLNLNKSINDNANEQLINGSVYFRFKFINENIDENGNAVELQNVVKNAYTN